MNKQLHTQGRLVVTNSRLYSEGAVIDCICNMQVSNQPCWEEDAHRLAACWNACIGIGTEVLEKMPDGSFLNSVAGVLKERDELLAALEGLLKASAGNGMTATEVGTAYHQAVIAKLQQDGHLGGAA